MRRGPIRSSAHRRRAIPNFSGPELQILNSQTSVERANFAPGGPPMRLPARPRAAGSGAKRPSRLFQCASADANLPGWSRPPRAGSGISTAGYSNPCANTLSSPWRPACFPAQP
jgi:hypothetical protein